MSVHPKPLASFFQIQGCPLLPLHNKKLDLPEAEAGMLDAYNELVRCVVPPGNLLELQPQTCQS